MEKQTQERFDRIAALKEKLKTFLWGVVPKGRLGGDLEGDELKLVLELAALEGENYRSFVKQPPTEDDIPTLIAVAHQVLTTSKTDFCSEEDEGWYFALRLNDDIGSFTRTAWVRRQLAIMDGVDNENETVDIGCSQPRIENAVKAESEKEEAVKARDEIASFSFQIQSLDGRPLDFVLFENGMRLKKLRVLYDTLCRIFGEPKPPEPCSACGQDGPAGVVWPSLGDDQRKLLIRAHRARVSDELFKVYSGRQ